MEQNMTAYQRVHHLTTVLNRYRHEYYNLNAPTVEDQVYDRLFDELAALEKETGIRMGNSPTQTVGYPAVSKLEKTTHTIPLLSLDKTKSSEELLAFMGEQGVLLMLKLDGLTIKLTYENGVLQEASTRGDGNEGEIVTHNVTGITGIPSHIPFKGRLVVTGEAFIRPSDFAVLQATLVDSNGKPYKNGRNLAAGSVRLLDAKVCKDRRINFMAFSVLEGFDNLALKSERLMQLWNLGFTVCHYLKSNRKMKLEELDMGIKMLQDYAKKYDVPIDGIVMSYNDVAYPYLLFTQDRGWKYADEGQRQAAYLREILVRHNKILNEEEFAAEAGEKYADAARVIYPKLALWTRSGIITPRELYNYARHLWCMSKPEALVYVQVGSTRWAVNNCDKEIPAERALEIVCREWCFDKAQVHIQVPAYYESTDWNYIRFQCGPLNWVMQNGELEQQYN